MKNTRRYLAFVGILLALSLFMPVLAAGDFWESPISPQENAILAEAMDLKNKVQGEPYDEAGLLTYRSENGEVTIMSCGEGAVGPIYIPAFINGEPVTAINDYAFLFCTAVTSVTLPETVNKVGKYAFFCCTTLSSVTFEGGVEEIGPRAFYRCSDLAQVHANGPVGKIGDYAFSHCDLLKPDALDFPSVSELGDYAFYSCNGLTDLPAWVGREPTAVGSYAFSECSGLTDVTIPAGVSSLGDGVFASCPNLKTATVSDGVAAERVGSRLFYDCGELTTAHLPSSWTMIPDETFYNCKKLQFTLPDNLTKIGAGAFYACEGLPKDLVIPSGVTEIGERAFQYCGPTSVTLPAGLKEVQAYSFGNCPELTHVSLPEGLVSVGECAFGGNSLESLELPSTLEILENGAFGPSTVSAGDCQGTVSEIELPQGLKHLGYYALACCTQVEMDELVLPEGLTYLGNLFGGYQKLVLPASLEHIGYRAFNKNEALTEVVIRCPESAFGIKDNVGGQLDGPFFWGCVNLTDVTIPEDWTRIPSYLFQSTGLTDITIPEEVESIGPYAFSYCYELSSVQLPDSLATIGNFAFANCYKLEDIQLPDSLALIGEHAFYKNSALTSIDLPDSLTSIRSGAFSNSGLTSLTLPANSSFGDSVFSNCVSLREVTIRSDLKSYLEDTNPGTEPSGLFAGCDNLTTVTFGAGVTRISSSSFENCASLQTVRLAGTVKSIGSYAFGGCSSLRSFNFPEGLEAIYRNAFQGTALTSVSLPSTLTHLEPLAFADIPTLTKVTLADGMVNDAFRIIQKVGVVATPELDVGGMEGYWANTYTTTDKSAFSGCSALRSISFPKNWTYIPNRFLKGCDGPLGTLTLGGNITDIGSYAFAEATGITEIKLPDGLQSLGSYALYGCTGLTSLTLPDGFPEDGLGQYALIGCPNLKEVHLPSGWTSIPAALFQDNQNIERFEVPEGIVRIGSYAFANSALKEISLPSTLTEIGAYAFQNCTGLTEIALPDGLKTLSDYAFNATGLTQVTVPGSVGTIGPLAFFDCGSLRSVEIQPGVSAIDALAFGCCTNLETVSIPDSVETLSGDAFYCITPEKLTILCSPDSAAEELVESHLYLSSNNYPGLEGAKFWFYRSDSDSILEIVDRYGYKKLASAGWDYYLLDYQGMSFWIGGQEATLLGWDPSWTSLTVPDDVGGIPITAFGNDTGTSKGVAYTMSSYNPETRTYESAGSQLRNLTIGSNIKTVDGDLFYCTNLETIIFSEGVTDIGHSSLYYLDSGVFEGLTSLTSIELPSTLTNIGNQAFKGCVNLTSVTFSEGLASIGLEAFADTGLTSVYLPSTLKEMHATAFDSDVTLHFTGDSGKVQFTYLGYNSEGILETYTVNALPDLLETMSMRIEQFTGLGLENQDAFFVETSSAGLASPASPDPMVGDVETAADTAPVLQDLEVSNEIVYDNAEEPAEAEVEPEDPVEIEEEPEEEEEVPEEEEEEKAPIVYELVLHAVDAVRNNPLVTALILCIAAAFIVFGAGSRWVALRKEN